jgi:hypothetical protein
MTENRFKDFGAGPDISVLPKISFKIHGEEFHAIPAVQGKMLLDLVKDANSDDPAVQGESINKFFGSVLEDESLERFNALLTDKHRIVTTETLGEVVGWLVEQYGDRPEAQPGA